MKESLLSNDVRIEDGSLIESSVLLPSVTIGRRCKIKRCILDENCMIPDGTQIGQDQAADQKRFFVTKRGVVLGDPGHAARARLEGRAAPGEFCGD